MQTMGAALKELDGRSREVLASVIATYIRSAAPVSSRQLSRTGTFALSSASLRNAMFDLEELGFLTHPHTSAGRVPTDRGYRAFVAELMPANSPTEADRAAVESELGHETFEMDRFLTATSRILSRLTGEVGIVAAPDALRFVLRTVHFARVAERKVLVIEVSEGGLVRSRLIETRDDHSSADLEEASRRLTLDFSGLSLVEIRARMVEALVLEKSRFDAALARALELGRRAFDAEEESDATLFVDGTESILEKPEFRGDLEAVRRVFRALDEKARLLRLLFDCLERPGPKVVIGSENPFTEEMGTSVVSSPYRYKDRVMGAIAVVGPKRMEYARIVPLVDLLGRYVSARLTETAA